MESIHTIAHGLVHIINHMIEEEAKKTELNNFNKQREKNGFIWITKNIRDIEAYG